MGLIDRFVTWAKSNPNIEGTAAVEEGSSAKMVKAEIARTEKLLRGTIIPKWEIEAEDWLKQSVDDCLDPELGALYRITKDLVPEELHGVIFVAGGFAAHLAGITNEHKDIDLFCARPSAFETMQSVIIDLSKSDPEAIEPGPGCSNFSYIECYRGRVIKFVYEGISYDLVDKPLDTQMTDVIGLLYEFDLNWSMCAINLESDIMRCNVHALSDTPRVNPRRTDDFIEGTIARLGKYSERLVKEPNAAEVVALTNLLNRRKARLDREAYEAGHKQEKRGWYV